MDNILIVGNGAVASAFARKLKQSKNVGNIFVAPGNGIQSENYQNVDIRETDLTGILKFVLENDVKFTLALSDEALKSDIAGFFTENGQNIFAPSYKSCKDFLNRLSEKKFLYKIHANPPKFMGFSRVQDAKNNLDDVDYPVIISSYQYVNIDGYSSVCSTNYNAQSFLNSLYYKGISDVLIEEFAYGKNFTMYFITDGYTALPVTSTCCEKFDKFGREVKFNTCFASNFYVSEAIALKLQDIANSIINILSGKDAHYLGFFGIQGIIKDEDNFVVQSIKTSFYDIEANAVLSAIECDFYELLSSCVNGFFSDEYSEIFTNDFNYFSAEIPKLNNVKMSENDNIDYINNRSAVITQKAATLSCARKYLNEIIEDLM